MYGKFRPQNTDVEDDGVLRTGRSEFIQNFGKLARKILQQAREILVVHVCRFKQMKPYTRHWLSQQFCASLYSTLILESDDVTPILNSVFQTGLPNLSRRVRSVCAARHPSPEKRYFFTGGRFHRVEKLALKNGFDKSKAGLLLAYPDFSISTRKHQARKRLRRTRIYFSTGIRVPKPPVGFPAYFSDGELVD